MQPNGSLKGSLRRIATYATQTPHAGARCPVRKHLYLRTRFVEYALFHREAETTQTHHASSGNYSTHHTPPRADPSGYDPAGDNPPSDPPAGDNASGNTPASDDAAGDHTP